MLNISNLSAGYPGRQVLSNLNLTIPGGSFTAIVGPNGCGKSTLLKAIVGLLPYDGDISLEQVALRDLSANARAKKIAYLPQSRSVPQLSVEKLVLHGRFPYLSYPRRYRQEDRLAAADALRALEIEDLTQRWLPALSGGERQKVYLAMALAQQTPVILMDEPTAPLDICHKFQVLSLARSLARQGKTVILVLHDLDLALTYADHIVVMEQGHIAAQGTAEEIISRGILETVFHIHITKAETDSGVRYCFYP